MTTISPSRKLVTLINVFTVEPRNQQKLIELLARATETSVRDAPGFISASLHRGIDGTKVTMYAQWRSVEDYQAMRENPAPLPYLQEALAIAKFDPGMYEVVETYSGSASESQNPPREGQAAWTENMRRHPRRHSVESAADSPREKAFGRES